MLSGPVCVVPGRCREQIRDKVLIGLRCWCETWFVQPCQTDIEFNNSLFITGAQRQASAAENQLLDFQRLATLASGVQQIKGLRPHDKLVDAIKEKLVASFRNALALAEDFDVQSAAMHSSGSVKISVQLGEQNCFRFFLQLSDLHMAWPEIFAPVSGQNAKLVNRRELLNNKQVAVSFSLASSALTFAQLLKLKKGNVLKLAHPLDKPLNATIGQQQLSLRPFLVKTRQQKAVILGN